jgi:predicted metal-dependent hydrolase
MNIPYFVKVNKRSRKVKIMVSGGRVIVSAPPRLSKEYLDRLVARYETWIASALRKHEKLIAGIKLMRDVFNKNEFAARTKELLEAHCLAIATPHGVHLGKVTIKKMRSRWGSCSGRGNISINLLLGHLPDELLEYVIVHEVCHLVHRNHSKKFWSLVAANSPEFKERKLELRRYNHFLAANNPPRGKIGDMM